MKLITYREIYARFTPEARRKGVLEVHSPIGIDSNGNEEGSGLREIRCLRHPIRYGGVPLIPQSNRDSFHVEQLGTNYRDRLCSGKQRRGEPNCWVAGRYPIWGE